MGNSLHLPHARTDDLPGLVGELTAAGVVVCALTPAHDAIPLDEITPAPRMAVLVGCERAGLSAAAMAAATHRVSIPMHDGVDSLNVATTAASVISSAGRASRKPPLRPRRDSRIPATASWCSTLER